MTDIALVDRSLSSLSRRAVTEGAVGSLAFAEVPPFLDHDLGLSGISEPFAVRAIIAQMELHQPRELQDHILCTHPPTYFDRQAFARVLIEHAVA